MTAAGSATRRTPPRTHPSSPLLPPPRPDPRRAAVGSLSGARRLRSPPRASGSDRGGYCGPVAHPGTLGRDAARPARRRRRSGRPDPGAARPSRSAGPGPGLSSGPDAGPRPADSASAPGPVEAERVRAARVRRPGGATFFSGQRYAGRPGRAAIGAGAGTGAAGTCGQARDGATERGRPSGSSSHIIVGETGRCDPAPPRARPAARVGPGDGHFGAAKPCRQQPSPHVGRELGFLRFHRDPDPAHGPASGLRPDVDDLCQPAWNAAAA